MSDPAAPRALAATPASNALYPGGAVAGPPPSARGNAMRGAPPDAAALDRQIGALSPAQKVAAARQVEILGVIGQGLAGYPYGQRRSILDHLAPALAARGIAPETIRAFDPTDANLTAALDEVAAIRQHLAGSDAAEPVPV